MRYHGMLIEKVCPILGAKESVLRKSGKRLSFALEAFPDWHLTFYSCDLHQLPAGISEANDIWLDRSLLQLLNESPQGISQSIISLKSGRGEQLYISAQDLVFEPGKQVRQAAEENNTNSRYAIRNRLAQWFSFRVLTLGQFMVSGEHGLSKETLKGTTSDGEMAELIHAAAWELSHRLKGYQAILIKDLCKGTGPMAQRWQALGYYSMPVDPSMKMDILPDWNSIDDYLLDISSKYRVRYRRTRKQLPTTLEIRELDLDGCKDFAAEMYQLYLDVKSEAAFDAVDLEPCYFVSLKKTLKNRLTVKGYFLEGTLIGFTTAIDNGGTLHAHYLGFKRELNRDFHLYHNMLFDLLSQGINGGYNQVDYGRTALEIKSSVGAAPHDYFCGILAKNTFYNRLVRIFTPAVFKPQPWTQRSPLKVR